MTQPFPVQRLVATRGPGRRQADRGFTLVELAVAMLIIGLLLASAMIPITAQIDIKANADTQRVMDQIRDMSDPEMRRQLLDQNVKLAEGWFGDVSLPTYAVVPGDPALTERGVRKGILAETNGVQPVDKFSRFLTKGKGKFQKNARKGLAGSPDRGSVSATANVEAGRDM